MRGRVQTGNWTADIETDAESAKRLIAFVLAAKRLNASSFAQAIDQIRFTINTKYSVEEDRIIAETWFTHPIVNEEAFESFALRLRPIIYDRDVCHFETVISISRVMLANAPQALDELSEIEGLYQSKKLAEQLVKMEALAQVAASSKWPVVNLWNVVFGGNLWMRQVFHDELFRYGFLYHWNAQNDKWMQYREIEKAAGGRDNILRCMIPFFQCRHLAITRLQEILIPVLHALGLEAEIEDVRHPLDVEGASESTAGERDSVASRRAIPEAAVHSRTEGSTSSVLDVLGIVRSLLPGQYLIEGHSWTFNAGDMKRRLSLGGSGGVASPQVNPAMQIAPVGILIDQIPAGETSITLEATPYVPPSA
jgi:hypothetical protein